MDCSLPCFSVHGILQARILEGLAMPYSRGSSQHRDQTRSPALQADSLPSGPPGKPQQNEIQSNKPNGDSQLTSSFTNNLYPVNLGSTKKEDLKKKKQKQGKLKKKQTNEDSLLSNLIKNLKFRKTFFTSLKRREELAITSFYCCLIQFMQ